MTIVICPGSYKGTLISLVASQIVYDELSKLSLPYEIVALPLADGGEGTTEVLQKYLGGSLQYVPAYTPLGIPSEGRVLTVGNDTVFIESSETIGYSLVHQSEFSPLTLSSKGLGATLKTVISQGYKKIYITMGDSIIMDLGLGMLSEMGVIFYSGDSIIESPTLSSMHKITDFDYSSIRALTDNVEIYGLVDTKDFLVGENGQAVIYGAQKGLKSDQVPFVESAYNSFLNLIEEKIGFSLRSLPMATGSGGIGGALASFFDAELIHFPDFLFSKTNLRKQLQRAHVLITGEGCLDEQSLWGKIPTVVASQNNVPCIALVGTISETAIPSLQHLNRSFQFVELSNARNNHEAQRSLRNATPRLVEVIRDVC